MTFDFFFFPEIPTTNDNSTSVPFGRKINALDQGHHFSSCQIGIQVLRSLPAKDKHRKGDVDSHHFPLPTGERFYFKRDDLLLII